MLIPVRKIGALGVLSDQDVPPEEAPMNALTDARSVNFRDVSARKMPGWTTQIVGFPVEPEELGVWSDGVRVSFLFGTLEGLMTSTDGVNVVGAVIQDSNGAPLGLAPSERWQFEVYGGFIMATNGVDPPLYSYDYDGLTDAWTFRPFPGWGNINSPTGPANVVREFKERIIALGVYGNPYTMYCSSFPEPAVLPIGVNLFAVSGTVASFLAESAQLSASLAASSGSVASLGATYTLVAALDASSGSTSDLQAVVPPTAALAGVVESSAAIGAVVVSPYTQNRIANNSLPTRAYLQRNTAFVATAGPITRLVVSFWFRTDTTGGHTFVSAVHYDTAAPNSYNFRVYRNSANQLILRLVEDVGNGIADIPVYTMGSSGETINGVWHHFLAHIDIQASVFSVWVDGVARQTNAAFTTNIGAGVYLLGQLNRWTIMGNVLATTGTSTAMNGAIGDLYIQNVSSFAGYDVSAFYGGGTPPDLNYNGGALTAGTPPLLFAGGDMTLTTGGPTGTGWNGPSATNSPTMWSSLSAGGLLFVRNGTLTATS